MLAFRAAGIPVEEYHAYEIDKFAIKSATHNFPDIQEHGDVFKADFTQYKNIDFLIGGSPCTYWSIAQKNNRETEASGIGWELFCQYVRALKEAQPKYFVYENNKSMSEAIRKSISQAFGFEPICINSALVSAQNRHRLYWVGKRCADGTYKRVNCRQPEDLHIYLADIIESGVTWLNKSYAYTTRCQAAIFKDTLEKHRHTMIAEPFLYQVPHGFNKGGIKKKKAPTFTANGAWTGNNKVFDNKVVITEISADGTPLTATSEIDKKTYTVYFIKNETVEIKGIKYPVKLPDGYYILRKLTVTEAKRLQTVPEDYAFPVSDTQAYKQLGNGWTVNVIKHLLETIIKEDLT